MILNTLSVLLQDPYTERFGWLRGRTLKVRGERGNNFCGGEITSNQWIFF